MNAPNATAREDIVSAHTATTGTGTATGTAAEVELAIGGMTCASCAARIEKKLNRMDGVEATVNYATEKAKVSYRGEDISVQDLIATVEKTGYTAHEPAPSVHTTEEGAPRPRRPTSCGPCGSGC